MSTARPSGSTFQLIFEGPNDGEAETLRKLRAALITDLELDVERAKFVLDMAPVLVRESSEESELTPLLHSLTASGAKALIVRHNRQKRLLKKKSSKKQEKDAPSVPTLKLDGIDAHENLLKRSERQDPWGIVVPREEIEEEPEIEIEEPPEVPEKEQVTLSREFITAKKKVFLEEAIEVEPELTRWERYRLWISAVDRRLRKLMNEEMVATFLLFSLASIITCSILIPLELYAQSARAEHYLKMNQVVDQTIDVLVFGPKGELE